MSTPNPVLATIIFVFAIQAIVLGVLILKKRPRQLSNVFLAVLVFFFALMAFNIALINVLISLDSFALFRYMQLELLFGIGPALYFYARSITDANFTFTWKDALHFIPVVLEFIFYRTPIYRLGADGLYLDPPHPYTAIYKAEQWLGVLSITVYALLALGWLFRHQSQLKQQYSNIEKRSLRWLKAPLFIFAFYWIGWQLLTEIDKHVFNRSLREIYFLPSFVGLSIVTCWIAFKGYVRTTLSTQIDLSPKAKPTYDSDTQQQAKMITRLMEDQKPYLDPDLDLGKLAQSLELNPKLVSQAINQNFSRNFYEYVNGYRVAAFKSRLQEANSAQLTLLGHALECGFNSKSTFNHVFKKNTGLTPREYHNSLQNRSGKKTSDD